jgi:hypothetical protein
MPSRRDYAEEYRRRQARARAEGFASDYDRRMRQGDPERAFPRNTEDAEYLRGHRGEKFLREYAREGDAVQVGEVRDAQGRFTVLDYYPTDPHREARLISVRGMSTDEILDLLDDLQEEGVAISAGYLDPSFVPLSPSFSYPK